MKIHLASDHAGYSLKEKVKQFLIEKGHEVEDHGAFELDEKDDYPDFVIPAVKAVASDKESRAIIFGGSGQGEAMVANRQEGVRATVYYGGDDEIVRLSREHNDSNVLSIGARLASEDEVIGAIRSWLEMSFSNAERHVRRLSKF